MSEIEIGIRVDSHNGLQFFGAKEADDLVQQGRRVVAIEPGGAIMRKVGEDTANVQFVLGGFYLKIKFDDSSAARNLADGNRD